MSTVLNNLRCRIHLTWDHTDRKEVIVRNPMDIYMLLHKEMEDSDKERFVSVLLTGHHSIIGIETVAIGSLHCCTVVPREAFKSAMLANASSVVFCHNHPSGDLNPSPQDMQVTRKLEKAGRLLGIPVIDHLIMTGKGYTSIRERMEKAGSQGAL